MTEQLYKKYMLTYLDILGFRAKVEKSKQDQTEIGKVCQALDQAQQLVTMVNKRKPGGWSRPIKARIFSDTILITIESPNFMSLADMITIVMELQFKMIQNGHFLRGATVVDDHYENNDYLFGPAIITAFEMERLAGWPRVLVHPSVLKETEKVQPVEPALKEEIDWLYIPRGKDGLRYMNYLECTFLLHTVWQWALEYLRKPTPEFLAVDVFEVHSSSILEALKMNEVQQDVRTLAKYHSLAMHHNEVIDRLCGCLSASFEVEQLTKNVDLANFYEHLKNHFLAFAEYHLPEQATDFFRLKMGALSKEKDGIRRKLIEELQRRFPEIYE